MQLVSHSQQHAVLQSPLRATKSVGINLGLESRCALARQKLGWASLSDNLHLLVGYVGGHTTYGSHDNVLLRSPAARSITDWIHHVPLPRPSFPGAAPASD